MTYGLILAAFVAFAIILHFAAKKFGRKRLAEIQVAPKQAVSKRSLEGGTLDISLDPESLRTWVHARRIGMASAADIVAWLEQQNIPSSVNGNVLKISAKDEDAARIALQMLLGD